MKSTVRNRWWLVICLLVLLVGFILHILVGKQSTPISEVFNILLGGEPAEARWGQIILEFRLPRALTAAVAGMALAVSGLLMQTFFRNPLAGPYVLGISSGSNLGVGILILAGGAFGLPFKDMIGTWSIALASIGGSFAVLLVIMLVAARVRDTVTLLIVGLMFASVAAGIVGVLEKFSTPEQLNNYVNWTFGSTAGVTGDHLWALVPVVLIGLILTIAMHKPLNAWLLGESYARSLGVDASRLKWGVIIATSLLAGGVTAFCGPISFLGLAVPHLARALLGTSDHRKLLPATIFLGAGILLLADMLTDLTPLSKSLPLNSVMTLFGAPVVIALIVRRRHMHQSF